MNEDMTAVIADISPESAENTRRILEKYGYRVICITDDGAKALRECVERRAGILIIDQVIPSLDGASAAKRIRKMPLVRYPAVIVACYPGLGVPIKLDIIGASAVNKPVSDASLLAAIESTVPEKRHMSGKTAAKLSDMLDRLGVPEHPGRSYLADAVFLAREDMALLSSLTGALYPMVARRNGSAPAAVERAMRHAIEAAWSTGNIEEQYSIFKGTIDAARGKPTCGGMIAQLSEMLRMEDVE